MSRPTPPRAAHWADSWFERALSCCAPPECDVEALLGDLIQKRAESTERVGRWRARIVFLAEAVVSCWFLLDERRRTSRPPSMPAPGRRNPARENSVTTVHWFENLTAALHSLRRSATFTATAAATLVLGIAGVTLMFAVSHATLVRDLPYPESERIVLVGDSDPGAQAGNTGYETYLDWEERQTSFEHLAIARSWSPTLLREGDASRLKGIRLRWNSFAVTGAHAQLGRLFEEADDHPDRRRIVVLSDDYWRREFAADPNIVGATLDFAGYEYSVVGVMDASHDPLIWTHLYGEAEVFTPLGYQRDQPYACRDCQHLKAFGKLKPGVTLADAERELETVQAELAQRFPESYSHANVTVLPLRDAAVFTVRPVVLALSAAVLALLLIACSNVASLQLARSSQKRRELSIRSALGASTGRLVRASLLENTVLWAGAAAAGVALAVGLAPLVAATLPAHLLPGGKLDLNLGVVAGTLAFTLLVTTLVGVLPSVGFLRRAGGRLVVSGRWVTAQSLLGRRVLVVANVALALGLVVGATLMMRSVQHLIGNGPGFEVGQSSIANLSFLGERYADENTVLAAQLRILDLLQSEPTVADAAFASQVPLAGNYDSWGAEVDGRVTGRSEDSIDLQRYSVTDGYFDILGIELLAGRTLDLRDVAGSDPVALVSESAVALVAPDGQAVGRRIRMGRDNRWRTIVGVVSDVRHEALGGRILPSVYLSQRQWTDHFVTLVLRHETADTPLESVVETTRKIVRAEAPGVPVDQAAALKGLALATTSRQRTTSAILATFSLTALFLATVGLYGLVSFLVEQRRREIGLRVALGAGRSQLGRWVLSQGAGLVFAGLGLGVLIAVGGARLLGSLVYETSLLDPVLLLQSGGALAMMTLLAHAAPLRRALQVDPMETLRRE